jgi:3-hydroxyisobutyrate dehydrogenase-like beta-hydroxyacid dehydrogenase
MARGDGVSGQNTVGVIGLGAMGLPIAGHLARSGRAALFDAPTDSRTLRELERMRLTWWAKDLDSVERLGHEIGRPMPVAEMCRTRMPSITVGSLAELLVWEPTDDPTP